MSGFELSTDGRFSGHPEKERGFSAPLRKRKKLEYQERIYNLHVLGSPETTLPAGNYAAGASMIWNPRLAALRLR
jgi:hypothetical protein